MTLRDQLITDYMSEGGDSGSPVFLEDGELVERMRRRGPGGTTHVWALPYGGALGKVLLYRKDLLDEKGVAYPDNEWTWDDLLDACRRVSDPARGIISYPAALAQSLLNKKPGDTVEATGETGMQKLHIGRIEKVARSILASL